MRSPNIIKRSQHDISTKIEGNTEFAKKKFLTSQMLGQIKFNMTSEVTGGIITLPLLGHVLQPYNYIIGDKLIMGK